MDLTDGVLLLECNTPELKAFLFLNTTDVLHAVNYKLKVGSSEMPQYKCTWVQ